MPSKAAQHSLANALFITSIVLLDAHQANADTTGVVRGSVITEAKPAAGVTVSLTGEGSVFNTVTGSDGRFSFLHVPYGRYMATARSSSGVTTEEGVDLKSNAVIDLPIDLSPKQIGRSQTTTIRGVASKPISVNTIDRAQIVASPENQSLNRLGETFPGIVRFSYNEPVAHGFHGLTYELDGIPLPQSTASQFSKVIDPRSIDLLEVFTGAFPAKFGGSRQGAVVNVRSQRSNTQALDSGDATLALGATASFRLH